MDNEKLITLLRAAADALHSAATSLIAAPAERYAAREALRFFIGLVEPALETIETAHRIASHWKTRRKFKRLEQDILNVAVRVRTLDEGLNRQNASQGAISTLTFQLASEYLDAAAARFRRLAARLEKQHAPIYAEDAEMFFEENAADPESPMVISQNSNLHVQYMRQTITQDVSLNTLVQVFFATDRKQTSNSNAVFARFADGRGEDALTYGVAEVSIPANHRMGKVERPIIWKFEFREDVRKHIVINTCEIRDEDTWKLLASNKLEEAHQSSAVIFIHGFNVAFDDAIRRTAQIARDLKFPGLAITYSWSAEGETLGYMADEDNVQLTIPRLREFFLMLRRDVGIASVHVIAHSMGNRALVEALKQIPIESPGNEVLKEVVLAAPDIDAKIFRTALKELHGKALRYTLYASSKDSALVVSRNARKGYTRAGDATDIVVEAGLETIDATSVGSDLLGLGHSYFSNKRTVLSDIFYLIHRSLSADSRAGLTSRSYNDMKYWLFDA